MAQTTVSLYPKYMMGEALAPDLGPVSFSFVTVGQVDVGVEGAIRLEQFDSIAVEQVEEIPIEITESVGIHVAVCGDEDDG